MRQLRSLAVLGLGLGLLPATGAAQEPPAPPAPPAAPAPAAGSAAAPVGPGLGKTPIPAQPPAGAPAAGAPGAAAAAEKVPVLKPAAKVASACPGKLLPLAVGNTWTYASVQSPIAPPEGMARLLPLRPQRIVVSVTGVEPGAGAGADTTVKLTEKVTYDIAKEGQSPKLFDQTIESTIVCNTKGKFEISPSSLFFAGEAGGYRSIQLTKLERKKETSLKLTNGRIGEQEWIEEIVAEYQKEAVKGSNAKLGSGRIEMERKVTPQPNENVRTALGIFQNTEKLGITTTGRIAMNDKVAPDGKPCTTKKLGPDKKTEITELSEVCELPANWISQIWLAEGFGVVQVLNAYSHMLQLVEYKVN